MNSNIDRYKHLIKHAKYILSKERYDFTDKKIIGKVANNVIIYTSCTLIIALKLIREINGTTVELEEYIQSTNNFYHYDDK